VDGYYYPAHYGERAGTLPTMQPRALYRILKYSSSEGLERESTAFLRGPNTLTVDGPELSMCAVCDHSKTK